MSTRIGKRIRSGQARAMTAAAPYGAGYGGTALVGLVIGAPQVTYAALGGGTVHAALRLREELGWHRKGGKAAARQRRRYQGTASRSELRSKLSPAAARARASAVCPDLPGSQAPVVIGRTGFPRRTVAGSRSDSYLLIAPPQTMKTGLISCLAEDAPGALLATSSRGDLYRHTAVVRSGLGDIRVLNADSDAALPSDFGWSPVSGCEDPQTAIRRAGDLMHASPRDPGGKDAWHEDRGGKLLRYMLHAAAIGGGSMADVAAWVHDPLCAEPMAILSSPAAMPGWAGNLAALTANDGDYLSGVIASAEAAIGWMDDPVMAAAACPADGGLDVREFVTSSGSVYLIGADRPHSSLAPYFSAFTSEVFEQSRRAAEADGGKLRVPMTMALDEAATICPVPLHKWTSVAAGYNITLIAGIQALSQLPARWGEHDGKTIRTNFTVKVIGGGFTDTGELEELSVLCGSQDTWHHVSHPDGSKTRQADTVRVYPPERIRTLQPWHALVVYRTARVTEVTVQPVWDRKDHALMPAPEWAPPAQRKAIMPAASTLSLPAASGPPVTSGAPVPPVPTPEEARI